MPVVPKVNVNRARGLGNQHNKVNEQTHRNDKCSYCRIVSHRSGSRPSHVKHAEVKAEDVLNSLQRVFKVVGQQRRNNAEAYKADTHKKARLKCLAEFHADAQTYYRKNNRHHNRGSEAYDIAEYLFHDNNDIFLILYN